MEPTKTHFEQGSGNCYLIENAINETTHGEYFYRLKNEVNWQHMLNRGNPVPRLVAVQGEIDHEGTAPLYRHPADEEPPLLAWTPSVDYLRKHAETLLSTRFNHALIQYYVDASHCIGRHSDKTLDITRGSDICNFSFGASRVMLVRDKNANTEGTHPSSRISLSNTSLFVLDWETNRLCHHQINKDGRDDCLKTSDETDFDGGRISITFRSVATFIRADRRIFGQGAICKNSAELNNQKPHSPPSLDEEVAMLNAFSEENKDPQFDWDTHYKQGFDAINFKIINSTSE
ncbi:hypothetical protein MNBD_GAMMA10-2855 [hydrothermal vent metagenome]|uniref:Alpha-ketoglutarate-dependent dioxygenase AlkB-like domain-containing protein n=1 Tax=hydrothermal vent metagenome TaxID=652676 RepID=A0A3B0XY03_9ZZZZ